MSFPTQEQNPAGLHLRYIVSKASGKPVDADADYLVFRIDDGGSDPIHVAAGRAAGLAYAAAIERHLPQVAADLRGRIPAAPGSPIGGRAQELHKQIVWNIEHVHAGPAMLRNVHKLVDELHSLASARPAYPILVDQDAVPVCPACKGSMFQYGLESGFFCDVCKGTGKAPAAASIPVAEVAGDSVQIDGQSYGLNEVLEYLNMRASNPWLEAAADLLQEAAAPAAAPVVIQAGGAGGWIQAIEGLLPTVFDEDGLTQKWLVCIDGQPSWEGHYYTKSGKWMVAGRYGYSPNVTHYMDYPAAPTA